MQAAMKPLLVAIHAVVKLQLVMADTTGKSSIRTQRQRTAEERPSFRQPTERLAELGPKALRLGQLTKLGA